MIGIKTLSVGFVALIASVGLLTRPTLHTDTVNTPIAAAYAAECAGFPSHIVSAIAKYYNPEGVVELENLPPSYKALNVQIQMAVGTCVTESRPVLPGTSVHFQSAAAFIDQEDVAPGSLPFYVIARIGGTGANAEYIAMQLPRPEIPSASQKPKDKVA